MCVWVLCVQIVMFIGFLEYIISQIVAKPGYIPGDYVGANDLFSEEGPHSQWETYQVCCGLDRTSRLVRCYCYCRVVAVLVPAMPPKNTEITPMVVRSRPAVCCCFSH